MKSATDVQHLCQISLLTLQRSRSKLKVKTAVLKKNLQLVAARLGRGSRYPPNLAIIDRSFNVGMKNDLWQIFKMADWLRFAFSEWFPNAQYTRRRRRDETVESCCVGGVYWALLMLMLLSGDTIIDPRQISQRKYSLRTMHAYNDKYHHRGLPLRPWIYNNNY